MKKNPYDKIIEEAIAAAEAVGDSGKSFVAGLKRMLVDLQDRYDCAREEFGDAEEDE